VTAPTKPPLIAAGGLSKYYPPSTWALREASLEIRCGETVAIVGASGSGKSTLLALLGLLDTPTEGRYLLDETDVTVATDSVRTALRRRYIGFIFQAFHLVPHLTVLENVLLGLRIKGVTGQRAHDAAREHLDRVGLLPREHARPNTLSGGEQQRTAIARALASEPRLVLCDEPTGNLDSQNSALVVERILASVSPSTAAVIVTHDWEVAERCARVLHVRDGVLADI
jgi:putative ABC transport system ATP-binding protein